MIHPSNRLERLKIANKKNEKKKHKEVRSGEQKADRWRKVRVERVKEKEAEDELRGAIC